MRKLWFLVRLFGLGSLYCFFEITNNAFVFFNHISFELFGTELFSFFERATAVRSYRLENEIERRLVRLDQMKK